jgi:hypothetical protein
MPIYTLLDEKTGRTMDVEGNQPPTPEVIEDLFAKYGEEVKPVQKQVYSPSQVERLAGQATAAGIPDKAVADFIQKSSSEFKQAFPEGFPTQELKAYTPEPVPTGMRSFAEFAGLRPFSGAAELPQQEAADRMRAMQTGLAAERMLPQVMRQATGGDLGTTTPFAQTLTPQEAVETQKETAKKMQEKYGVPEWVTDAATVGGAPLDIAISTGLPLAGSLATRNPQVGGVVASAVANPIVQYRQMLRGERPSFSWGEFGVDVALGAYVPRPVQETEAAINALRGTLDGVGPMTGAQRAAETIITRAGQGTAIGLGGELARQTIDEPSIDVKQVLNVGAISTLFGATFGGLELGAPKVWGKIKDLPLTDALRKLYQEPQTPAVSKAIKEMEEMAARKAAEAPAAATAEAPAAKPVAEVPITAADAKPVAEEPTPAQQLEVLTKRLGQERELLKSYPEMSDTIQDRIAQLEADISSLKTSERAANVPETVDPKNPPAVDQASVEAKRTELEDRVSYLDELLASKEITPDEHVTLVAAAKEEAEKLAAIKFDSPASNPEVNKAAAIIAEANSKQEAALAREGLNIGDQVSEAGILGRDDTLTPRAPATQSSQEQANARLKRIMRGLELDGVPPSAVGVALGRQLADLSVSDPRRFSFLRKQLIDSVNPPRTDAAIPGVTKLKEFEQLTPEMVGVKAEEPITPKKSGVLPGKIPILEGAEPRPVGLGEPPLPTTPRMLELEQPIFDSGQVDQFGNKIWVDQQNRPVDPRVYNEARDRSRYGGAMQQLVFSASGAGGGFVVGWNTGEGLPPEERLQRAINFGLGGMFAPTAIRKIISLQGWANGVLRDRGPGTGALNTADPQILGALAVKGATLVGEGVKNFAEWSRIMVGKFGGEIRPKLREIWAAGEQAKLIPVGAITDAPSPKVTGDKLPGNTAGELLYSDYPKSPVKRTNGEVAELVQDAAITANGKRITSENITPAQERRIVDNGVDEVVAGLKTANHAGEWYTTQVDDGNTVLGVMFPVVRDDGLAKASGKFDTAREARVAAAVAQAATSQNLTVPENGKYTIEQFEALLKNGKFDPSVAKKYGTKGRSIAGNLELANKMVDAVGWSGLDDFIRKDFTVRELTQAIKAATGRDVSISGKMDDVVQGAAIFGPKIGQGFLQNLLGRFDPVTIDLWMRRTWGRWTGDVLAEGIKPEQLGRYVKTLRDAGFELPQSLRGMRITPKGAKKLMIPESLNERLATDPKWKEEIYNHALKIFERWDKDIYPYIKGNMTPKQKEDVLSGKLSIEALADQLRKSDARIEAAWSALPEAGIARPRGKGSKAGFVEGMEASVGRTVDLSNEEISKLKPEWAKSSTVIVNVFEPIDIPSNRDREVITRVVNSIRKKLEDRGIRMTNADIQATLWYPEKDIWAKLAGEPESGLKQSYDTVFLKLAEERGLGNQASEALAAARAARAGRGVVAGRTEAIRKGVDVGEINPAKIERRIIGETGEIIPTRLLPEGGFYVSSYERGRDFAGAIARTKADHPYGPAVEVKKEDFYRDPKNLMFFSKDGLAGAVVKPDGDLVSVFKHPSSSARMSEILAEAAKMSLKLDAFDINGLLPSYYAKHGFRPVARVKFNDAYAPEGWKFDTMGRPDIVFMVRDPKNRLDLPDASIYKLIQQEVPLVDIDEAAKLQQAALDSLAAKTVTKETTRSGLDPKTAGFVSRQLGLSLSGFAGGFTYGMIEARDKPPEQRLTNALLMGAAGGALSPLVLGKALKAINSMPAKPPPATQAVIGSAKPPRTLEDVRRIFDEKPDTPSFAERFRKLPANTITALQNKYYPLAELQKSVLGILPKLNLADRFSLVAGAAGKAEADLIELGRSREALIPDVNSRDLNGYMFLRRAFDRLTTEAKNPEAGSRQVSDFTLPEIQTHLANLRNELGTDKMMRLEKFAEELQKSADADLQLMISSGRMSKQQYDEIKALNEFYAPFYVMEYLSQREGALPGITGAIDTTQPLTKQITGINDKDFKLGDMMTAFGANKLRSYVLAEKNMAMRDLAALVPSDPKGNFIKDLGFAAADISPPKGWETVNYMIDGKVRRLAVSPEVARAVKNMDGQQLNLVSRILSTAATPLRTGATGLNLAFQVVNQFKDLGRLGLMSKYGLRSVSDLVMFPLDVASAAASSWKSNVLGSPDELMMEYLRSGAARSTIASQLSPDTFTRFAQQKDQSAAAKLLGVPVRTIIDTTTKIGNAIEETAKLAGFKRGLRIENLDKLSGTARDEAIQRLAYEVRNYAGSPDFSKHGTIGREMNLLFMFLNARIQGTAADLRRLIGGTGSREGWEAALKLAGGVGTFTTYVWYYNHQPDNIDDYNSRPLTERNNYFLFPRYNKAGEPMYYINEDGEKVREYRRFPKGEIIGLVANITEGALDFFAKKDPSAAVNAGLTVLENLSPISISGRNIDERFESVLSGLNPILKAPIEYTTNRNLFGHRDVVPRKLQQASPELQYRETTAPQFIQAAEAMPDWAPEKMRSPLHLQQLVSNFTGGLLTQFMRPELEGRDPLSSNPVLGRFFSAPYLDKEEDWNEVKKYQTKQTDIAITRERAIDSFIKNSDRMPIGERMEALKQIIVADPERNARALLNNLKDRQAGTTNIDQAVRNLTPNLRAQYLEDRRAKLPDAQSQSQFYMQMYQRGVLTPETVAEIAKLRKLQGESAGNP